MFGLAFVSNAIWTGIDRFLCGAVNFYVFVMIAVQYGPAVYGELSYILSIVFMVYNVNKSGVDAIASKQISGGQEVRRVLSNAIYSRVFTWALTMSFVVIPFWFTSLELRYFLIFFWLAHLISAFDVIESYYTARYRFKVLSLIRIGFVLVFAASKVFVVVLDGEMEMLLAIYIIESLMRGIAYAVLLFRAGLLISKVQVCEIGQMLLQSFPVMIASLFVMVYTRIDQIMIEYFLGMEEVGLYSAGVRVIEICYVLPAILAIILYPRLCEYKVADVQYYRSLTICGLSLSFYVSLLPLAILMGLDEEIVHLLYGEEFASTSSLVAWLALLVPLAAIGLVRTKWLIVEGKQRYIPILTFVGAFANVVLNYLMIPVWGGVGACWASVLSFFIVVAVVPSFFKDLRSFNHLILHAFLPHKSIKALMSHHSSDSVYR